MKITFRNVTIKCQKISDKYFYNNYPRHDSLMLECQTQPLTEEKDCGAT